MHNGGRVVAGVDAAAQRITNDAFAQQAVCITAPHAFLNGVGQCHIGVVRRGGDKTVTSLLHKYDGNPGILTQRQPFFTRQAGIFYQLIQPFRGGGAAFRGAGRLQCLQHLLAEIAAGIDA